MDEHKHPMIMEANKHFAGPEHAVVCNFSCPDWCGLPAPASQAASLRNSSI